MTGIWTVLWKRADPDTFSGRGPNSDQYFVDRSGDRIEPPREELEGIEVPVAVNSLIYRAESGDRIVITCHLRE